MAQEKIGFDITVNGVERTITSFKDLKKATKDLRDEQLVMSAKFGDTSEQAKKVGQKLADLKDKVEDLNDSTKSLKGSGVEKLTSSFRLLGEGIGTFDFDKIKLGFKGVGAAMSAIPIFLIIEGLKLLYENFDKVKEVVAKLIPALKETVSIKNELNNASLEGAKNAAIEKNNLDNLYKASTDQTKSLEERKKAQIALQDSYPLTFKNFSDEQFALGLAKKGYDDLSKSILDSSMLKAKQSLLDKQAVEFAEGEQKRLNEITEAKEKLTSASKKANVSIDIESKTRQVLTSDYENQQSVIDDLIKANSAEAEAFKKKNADILGDLAQHQEGSNKLDAEQAAAKEKADKLLADKLLNNNKNYGKKAAEDKFADEKRLLADIENAKEQSYIKTLKSEQTQAIAKAQFENDKLIEDINLSTASKATKNQALVQAEITLQDNIAQIQKDYKIKKDKEDEAAEVKRQADADKAIAIIEADEKKKIALQLSNLESGYQLELEKDKTKNSIKLQNVEKGSEEEKAILENAYQEKLIKEKAHLEEIYKINIANAELLGLNTTDLTNKYLQEKEALENAARDKKTEADKKAEADEKNRKSKLYKDILEAAKLIGESTLLIQKTQSDLYYTKETQKNNKLYRDKLKNVVQGSKEEKAILEQKAKDEKDLARQQFETQKKFNRASAILNGILGIGAVFATPDPTLGIIQALRVGALAISTAANVAAINATQFDEGGASGGAIPAATDAPTTSQAPAIYGPGQGQSTTFSGNQNNNFAPVKAYVVETENRSTTNRVNKLVSESTYG